jgi:hypothetical protein
MRAEVHFYGLSPEPVGIWWVNDFDGLSCVYAPGYEPEEAIGRLTMTNKAPGASWEDLFDSLERSTRGSGWEPVELLRMSPQEYLDQARKGRRSA